MVTLNLPPVPAELRSIAPYLQRANELKTQEPIIAYWCAYYAAQLGISAKTRDPTARTFLLELLGSLETAKKEIGPSDVIDDENASSALVESFALKVFNMADNEDRKGQATRGTAKKFLAAAHFLEIISVFGAAAASDGVSESTTAEKIKYAKWKAADIAKAFREGRKPTPGPADGEGENVQLEESTMPAINVDEPLSPPMNSSPSGISRLMSPPHLRLPDTPIPPLTPTSASSSPAIPPPVNSAYINPDALSASHLPPQTPSNWSIAATPGTPDVGRYDPDDVVAEGNPTPTPTRRAWVSTDVDGRNSDSDLEEDTTLNRPQTSQTVSATSTTTADPWVATEAPSSSTTTANIETGDIEITVVTPPAIPSAPHVVESPSTFVPSAPSRPPGPPPPTPARPMIPPAHVIASPPPPLPKPEPVVLTPKIISKTQRHCKFAISALDYEDAETARKELKAALAMLGG